MFDLDLEGVLSWDLQGSPNNVIISVDLGGGNQATMNGIGWDLTLTTFDFSWANEAVIGFEGLVNLTPGFQTTSPVSGAHYSSSILKLADVGIPDIVLADGILDIEFFESFDVVPNEADGVWNGTLHIQYLTVPTPGAFALLGLGGFVGLRRRRR